MNKNSAKPKEGKDNQSDDDIQRHKCLDGAVSVAGKKQMTIQERNRLMNSDVGYKTVHRYFCPHSQKPPQKFP